jgi:hypothetical protein
MPLHLENLGKGDGEVVWGLCVSSLWIPLLVSVDRKAENWNNRKGSLRLEALEISHKNYPNPILYDTRSN